MAEISSLIKPKMICAFYSRVSTDKQDMKTQEESVKRFAVEYGCKLVYYVDQGVSATKKKIDSRENLKRLLEDAKKEIYDFVAVYKEDRLARDPYEHEYVRLKMLEADKPIIITSTRTIYDEPDPVLRVLRSGLTAYEATLIQERTRDSLEALIQQGKWAGGQPPYGYKYRKNSKYEKRFEAILEEQAIVKSIFKMYQAGYGCGSIAAQLPSASHRGRNWTRQAVESVIKNPFYAGFLTWGKRTGNKKNDPEKVLEIRSKYIEPIITKEEWEECRERYISRSSKKVDPKKLQTNFLLRDIVRCNMCDERPLLKCDNQRTKGKERMYGQRKYICPRCRVWINSDQIDKKILLLVAEEITKIEGNLLEKIREKNEKESKEIAAEILSFEKEISELQDSKRRIESTIEEWKQKEYNIENDTLIKILILYVIRKNKRIDLLEQEIKNLQSRAKGLLRLKSDENYWKPFMEIMSKHVTQLTNPEKRQLVLSLFDSIGYSYKTVKRADREEKIDYVDCVFSFSPRQILTLGEIEVNLLNYQKIH